MNNNEIRQAIVELLSKNDDEIAEILGADIQDLYNTLDNILNREFNNDEDIDNE